MNNDDKKTIYRKPASEWKLKVIQGFDAGEVFTLNDSQDYTIGRQSCDITINQHDKKASRRHARLVFKKNQPLLENLSRTTATYVNNKPVKKIKLKAGDEIGIGDTLFVLEKTGASQPKSKINIKLIGISACVFILMLIAFQVFLHQPSPVKLPAKKPTPAPSQKPTAPPAPVEKPSALPVPAQRPDTPIDKEKAAESFRQGKSFYRGGHLKRAIRFFESASSYNPDHPLAAKYLQKAKDDLDKKLDQLNRKAEKSKTMLKYEQAKLALREIIELLSDSTQDKRYTDAQAKLCQLENR